MDKYKIIKTYLHKSFYSELIKAFDNTGTMYMIKKIPLYCQASEIDILKKLKHPNIVKYYESFKDRRHHYLVQEYIDGVSLDEYIKDNTLSNKDIKNILIELIRAVKYLNYQQIYHLDIRPCNIMYDFQKKATLIDFGCSQIKSEKPVEKNYFGIMNHLPPEFIKNNGELEKVDIWGIGIILYYMIFKTIPFLYSKETLTQEINYEETCNTNIKKIFLELLKNILIKDVKKRYTIKQIEYYLEKLELS